MSCSPPAPMLRRFPVKDCTLPRMASTRDWLRSMIPSIPSVMRVRFSMMVRRLFSPSSPPSVLRMFAVTAPMSPAIFESWLNTSFMPGCRTTFRISSPSLSSR